MDRTERLGGDQGREEGVDSSTCSPRVSMNVDFPAPGGPAMPTLKALSGVKPFMASSATAWSSKAACARLLGQEDSTSVTAFERLRLEAAGTGDLRPSRIDAVRGVISSRASEASEGREGREAKALERSVGIASTRRADLGQLRAKACMVRAAGEVLGLQVNQLVV